MCAYVDDKLLNRHVIAKEWYLENIKVTKREMAITTQIKFQRKEGVNYFSSRISSDLVRHVFLHDISIDFRHLLRANFILNSI